MRCRGTSIPPALVHWGSVPTPVCKLAVGLTDKGEVCRIAFLRGQTVAEAVAEWQSEWVQTTFTRGAEINPIEELPILLTGTPFQLAVWQVIAKIPKGQLLTYGEIAQRINKPKTFRAVGAACGANPVPYLVPCHRVVAANGALGGFTGGLEIKKILLKAEGVWTKTFDKFA